MMLAIMSHRNTVVMLLIDYQVINFIYDINNCSNDNESVYQFYKWLPFPTDSLDIKTNSTIYA